MMRIIVAILVALAVLAVAPVIVGQRAEDPRVYTTATLAVVAGDTCEYTAACARDPVSAQDTNDNYIESTRHRPSDAHICRARTRLKGMGSVIRRAADTFRHGVGVMPEYTCLPGHCIV